MNWLEIVKSRTTAYKPSKTGAIEGFYRTLDKILCKFVKDSARLRWDVAVCTGMLSSFTTLKYESLIGCAFSKGEKSKCRPICGATSELRRDQQTTSWRNATRRFRSLQISIRETSCFDQEVFWVDWSQLIAGDADDWRTRRLKPDTPQNETLNRNREYQFDRAKRRNSRLNRWKVR